MLTLITPETRIHWSIGDPRGLPLPTGDIEILLDGVKQKRVRAFDTKLGFVRVLLEDEAGDAHLDPRTGELAEEDRFGAVEVRTRSEAAEQYLLQYVVA